MNDISIAVQRPSPNYRSNEDWEIIPSNRKPDDITDENSSLSETMQYYIPFVLDFCIIIHILFFLGTIYRSQNIKPFH